MHLGLVNSLGLITMNCYLQLFTLAIRNSRINCYITAEAIMDNLINTDDFEGKGSKEKHLLTYLPNLCEWDTHY